MTQYVIIPTVSKVMNNSVCHVPDVAEKGPQWEKRVMTIHDALCDIVYNKKSIKSMSIKYGFKEEKLYKAAKQKRMDLRGDAVYEIVNNHESVKDISIKYRIKKNELYRYARIRRIHGPEVRIRSYYG
jgi:hypothetical protein